MIAVIAIPVAWATSVLKPPVVEQPIEPTADVEPVVLAVYYKTIWRSVRPSIASRHGEPNQVVSASRNPVSVPSPTQAMYPSGLISTAAGAATWPRTGSSHVSANVASIT